MTTAWPLSRKRTAASVSLATIDSLGWKPSSDSRLDVPIFITMVFLLGGAKRTGSSGGGGLGEGDASAM